MEVGYYCDSFAHFAMIRAQEQEEDVDTVFMAFNTWWTAYKYLCASVDGRCVRSISVEEARHLVLLELAEHIQKLVTARKKVIVSLPFPMYDKSIPDLEIRNATFGRFGLSGIATDITLPATGDQIAAVAEETGADIFDPRKSLCKQKCITELNGVSIYKDDNDIAASEIGVLETLSRYSRTY